MSVPNIEDLTEPPIVGKFYMVPCVRKPDQNREWGEASGWVPILGPRHSDEEIIGFSILHYHYDPRFLTPSQWDRIVHAGTVAARPHRLFAAPLIDGLAQFGPPVLRPRKCHRLMPRVPFSDADKQWQKEGKEFWLRPLEEHYASKRVTCGKCPHRGLPLLSLPREPGTDIVTCVGHGLRWDLKTGELVR